MELRLTPAQNSVHDISHQITIKIINLSSKHVKGRFLYLEDLHSCGHVVASCLVVKRYESVEQEEEGQLIFKRDIY